MNEYVITSNGTAMYLDTPMNRWRKFILSLPPKTIRLAVEGMLFYYNSLNRKDEVVAHKVGFLSGFLRYLNSINYYNSYLKPMAEYNLERYTLVSYV